ncbi:MAG: hypothetical protein AAF610_03840 [Pseudomonadota bacterium]
MYIVIVLVAVLMAFISGCVSGKSLQDRHHMSRLVVPSDGDYLIFEASTGVDYPADDADAEAVRRDWIRQWLERRGLCANGFEVIKRVELGDSADNPYRHDLRYTLRCATP